MRMLHTADWHLGHELNGHGRLNEHAAFLDWLVTCLDEKAVDVLVVAGDVYDHQNPSSECQRLFFRFIVEAKRIRPGLSTVIVAGNHDSPGRLEAPRELLRHFDVTVVGATPREDLGRLCLPLKTARGEIAAHVLAAPFLRPSDLPGLGGAMFAQNGGSPVVDAIRNFYAAAYEKARPRLGGAPLIVTGHLHVAGGAVSEMSERRILAGGEHAVPPDIFPSEAAYVALGHLHRPQSVGSPNVRYAGSPFPLSAGERTSRHEVVLIDLSNGRAEPERIATPRRVAHLRLPESGALTPDELPDALAGLGLDPDLPEEERPFVEIRLRVTGPTPSLRTLVDQAVARAPVRLSRLAIERPETEEETTERPPELAEARAEDLFRRAFLREHGTEPDPAHLIAFREIEQAAY